MPAYYPSFALHLRRFAASASVVFAGLVLFPAASPAGMVPGHLQCEGQTDPVGIEIAPSAAAVGAPVLGWITQEAGAPSTAVRGWKQSAYQVIAASSPELLTEEKADLWNSRKVSSDNSINIPYGGKPLVSAQRVFWKIRVWDHADQPSDWSQPARWITGLVGAADWKSAQWVGLPLQDSEKEKAATDDRPLPARQLRREFDVAPGESATPGIRAATVFYSGQGISELYLNGQKVGDEVLSPPLTDYDKRYVYVAHDVTSLLKPGRNALGVWLGNGRFWAMRLKRPTGTRTFGVPMLKLVLRIERNDGTVTEVVSDPSWKATATGPVVANNEYDGEDYDARREFAGWSESGYRETEAWKPAEIFTPKPEAPLVACRQFPIRVTETLSPISVTPRDAGAYIYDLGQNMVGWARLKVTGPAGTTVKMRFSETLDAQGNLQMANLRGARCTDTYTLKGGGVETWEPRFTYHGFRYVEVTGYPGTPDAASLEGRVVHDDIPVGGSMTCSNDLVNKIYRNVWWGISGNYRSLPTDCPQRDERQGWLGDRTEESSGEASLFDHALLYAKWEQDIADSQHADGKISDVCPNYWPLYHDNVVWPSTFITIPGMLLRQYGDRATLERTYPQLKIWTEQMAHCMTPQNILPCDTYGDWCVPPPEQNLDIHTTHPELKTPAPVLGTSYYYHVLQLMSGYAALLGKPDDQRLFDERAAKLRAGFDQAFWNAEGKYYGNGSATSQILPLAFDMIPEEKRQAAFDHLVEWIEKKANFHIANGLVGQQWLMRVLTRYGRADLAYKLLTERSYPSWGYMAESGATTIWELWNGNSAKPDMNSGNHVMLVGDLVTWLNENVAGIQPAEPGFKRIAIEPLPVGDLQWVKAERKTPYGPVVSAWKKTQTGGNISLRVEIPPNTMASVIIPAQAGAPITESGKPAAGATGVKLLKSEAGKTVFEVGSGTYEFESGNKETM